MRQSRACYMQMVEKSKQPKKVKSVPVPSRSSATASLLPFSSCPCNMVDNCSIQKHSSLSMQVEQITGKHLRRLCIVLQCMDSACGMPGSAPPPPKKPLGCVTQFRGRNLVIACVDVHACSAYLCTSNLQTWPAFRLVWL